MTIRRIAIILAALAAFAVAATAPGAKIHLKDGRVLEGEIVREEPAFIFVKVRINGVAKDELVMRADILKIEDDGDAADDEAPDRPSRPDRVDRDDEAIEEEAAAVDTSGAIKAAFITLEGTVGIEMNADVLSRSVEALDEADPDIVVLRINSGGGIGVEVQRLSDVIEYDIKPNYRVVAWIESAISAAAMTAITCEEMYFMNEGNLGAATGFRQVGGGKTQAIEGRELNQMLAEMERISARGNREPLVMRAMQVPTNLSADIDASGRVTWRNDLEGEYIVSTENEILTFDSRQAVKFNYANGVANGKDELMRALGCIDWVEVAPEADRIQQEYREDVQRGNTELAKAASLFNLAMNNGDWTRARRHLGTLKAWARRVPAFERYGVQGAGLPPLNDRFFREVERQIEDALREEREQARRRNR